MSIVTRSQWGTNYPNLRGEDVTGRLPWGEVVIHTEAGAQHAPAPLPTECQWIRAIEGFHVNTRKWQGIAYSFLIAPSGRVFEGRGWGRSGAHTEGRNGTAAGVCFLGHGDKWPATEAQWQSAAWLIGEGIRLGNLTPNPKVSGHRDYSTKGKTCPGNLVYPYLDRLRGITGPVTEGLSMSDISEILKRLDGLAAELDEVRSALGVNDPKGPLPERIRDGVARIDERTKEIVIDTRALTGK